VAANATVKHGLLPELRRRPLALERTLIAIFTAVATASLLVTPAAAARPTGPRGLRNWDGIGRPGAARSHGVAARAEDPEGAPWPIHLQHTIGLGSWRCPCADVSR
jgi:hypothetical protein